MNCFRSWPHWFYLFDSPRGRVMLILSIINIAGMKLVCDMDCDIIMQQNIQSVTSRNESVNNNNDVTNEAMEKFRYESADDDNTLSISIPKLYDQFNFSFTTDATEAEFVTVVSIDEVNTEDYVSLDNLSTSFIAEIKKNTEEINPRYEASESKQTSFAIAKANRFSNDPKNFEILRSIWLIYLLFFAYNSFLLFIHILFKVFTFIVKDVYGILNSFTFLYNWILMLTIIMLVEKPTQSPFQYVLVIIQTLFSTLLWSNAWQRFSVDSEELEMELPWENSSIASLEPPEMPPYDYPALRQVARLMENYGTADNNPNSELEAEVDLGEISRLKEFLNGPNSGETRAASR